MPGRGQATGKAVPRPRRFRSRRPPAAGPATPPPPPSRRRRRDKSHPHPHLPVRAHRTAGRLVCRPPPPSEQEAAPMHDTRRLNILLAGPRGFCAGVDRAIKIVEEAIRRYGAPVYVRHEIVHNRFVVREPGAPGRRLRRGAGRGAGRRAGGVLRPWRAEERAGRGDAAEAVLPRRHLPAGQQGPPRGRAPRGARPPPPADRPCRPPGGGGHHGPARTGHRHPGGGRGAGGARRGAGGRRRSPSSPRPRSRWTTPRRSWPRCNGASPASRRRPRRTSATPPPTGRRR